MEAEQIRLEPDPYEPFHMSLGFRVGDLLILSGLGPSNARGELVGAGDFDAQAELTFASLAEVLAAGGSSLADVVKVTIYLTDLAHLPRVRELRPRYFTPPYPADTLVCVSSLADPEQLLEIEAIAVAKA